MTLFLGDEAGVKNFGWPSLPCMYFSSGLPEVEKDLLSACTAERRPGIGNLRGGKTTVSSDNLS